MGYPTTPLQMYSMTADRDPTSVESQCTPIDGDGTPIMLDPVFFETYVTVFWKNLIDNTLFYLQSATLNEGGNPKNSIDYTLIWTKIF